MTGLVSHIMQAHGYQSTALDRLVRWLRGDRQDVVFG